MTLHPPSSEKAVNRAQRTLLLESLPESIKTSLNEEFYRELDNEEQSNADLISQLPPDELLKLNIQVEDAVEKSKSQFEESSSSVVNLKAIDKLLNALAEEHTNESPLPPNEIARKSLKDVETVAQSAYQVPSAEKETLNALNHLSSMNDHARAISNSNQIEGLSSTLDVVAITNIPACLIQALRGKAKLKQSRILLKAAEAYKEEYFKNAVYNDELYQKLIYQSTQLYRESLIDMTMGSAGAMLYAAVEVNGIVNIVNHGSDVVNSTHQVLQLAGSMQNGLQVVAPWLSAVTPALSGIMSTYKAFSLAQQLDKIKDRPDKILEAYQYFYLDFPDPIMKSWFNSDGFIDRNKVPAHMLPIIDDVKNKPLLDSMVEEKRLGMKLCQYLYALYSDEIQDNKEKKQLNVLENMVSGSMLLSTTLVKSALIGVGAGAIAGTAGVALIPLVVILAVASGTKVYQDYQKSKAKESFDDLLRKCEMNESTPEGLFFGLYWAVLGEQAAYANPASGSAKSVPFMKDGVEDDDHVIGSPQNVTGHAKRHFAEYIIKNVLGIEPQEFILMVNEGMWEMMKSRSEDVESNELWCAMREATIGMLDSKAAREADAAKPIDYEALHLVRPIVPQLTTSHSGSAADAADPNTHINVDNSAKAEQARLIQQVHRAQVIENVTRKYAHGQQEEQESKARAIEKSTASFKMVVDKKGSEFNVKRMSNESKWADLMNRYSKFCKENQLDIYDSANPLYKNYQLLLGRKMPTKDAWENAVASQYAILERGGVVSSQITAEVRVAEKELQNALEADMNLLMKIEKNLDKEILRFQANANKNTTQTKTQTQNDEYSGFLGFKFSQQKEINKEKYSKNLSGSINSEPEDSNNTTATHARKR